MTALFHFFDYMCAHGLHDDHSMGYTKGSHPINMNMVDYNIKVEIDEKSHKAVGEVEPAWK